jgi:phosphohistidine phosphatase SixA
MPDLSELASQLLAGHARMDVEFKKSGVCCLSFDGPPGAGRGRLEWLMQPRHLQHMG